MPRRSMTNSNWIFTFLVVPFLFARQASASEKYPVVSPNSSTPLCSMQTSDGRVIDLSSICGKVDPNQALQSSLFNAALNKISSQNQSLVKKSTGRSCQEILSSSKTEFSNASTRLRTTNFVVNGNQATLKAIEDATFQLEISACDSSAPATTESQQEHLFVFAKDNGNWKLSQHSIENGLTNAQPEAGVPVADSPPMTISAIHLPVAISSISETSESNEFKFKFFKKESKLETLEMENSESQDELEQISFPETLVPKFERILLAQAHSLNRYAIVDYAKRHWKDYNRSYRDFSGAGGDCTNFVSQALAHGWWREVTGYYDTSSAWWYRSYGRSPSCKINLSHLDPDRWVCSFGQSRTWVNAHWFYWFMRNRPRGYSVSRISDLQLGDVLQVDFTRDGTVDHTMIVTHIDSRGERYLTYHTNNTLNKSFSNFYKDYPNAYYYAWRLYDRFN